MDIVVTPGQLLQPENGNQLSIVTIHFRDKLSDIELSLLPGLLNQVQKEFPGCIVAYEKIHRIRDEDVLQVNVESPPTYDVEQLQKQINELTVKLRIAQQRYIEEKGNREALDKRLSAIMKDTYPILLEKLRATGELGSSSNKNMTVMLLDVVGFSAMNNDERIRNLDLLRSLARAILKNESGLYINTWGDAIVAAFDDVESGLRCACKFVQQFSIVGLDVRVGLAWGLLRITSNELKGSHDIDGDAINLCARIEPLAERGTVLCHEDVIALLPEGQNEFNLRKRNVALKKGAAGLGSGDEITTYEVRLLKNV
ncbi:MAG: adenylate/guanylate cyclase domain-containing protein [Caulobacter sp.]